MLNILQFVFDNRQQIPTAIRTALRFAAVTHVATATKVIVGTLTSTAKVSAKGAFAAGKSIIWVVKQPINSIRTSPLPRGEIASHPLICHLSWPYRVIFYLRENPFRAALTAVDTGLIVYRLFRGKITFVPNKNFKTVIDWFTENSDKLLSLLVISNLVCIACLVFYYSWQSNRHQALSNDRIHDSSNLPYSFNSSTNRDLRLTDTHPTNVNETGTGTISAPRNNKHSKNRN